MRSFDGLESAEKDSKTSCSLRLKPPERLRRPQLLLQPSLPV